MPDLYLDLDSATHSGVHRLSDVQITSEVLSILNRWAAGVDFEVDLRGAGDTFTYRSSEIAAITFRR